MDYRPDELRKYAADSDDGAHLDPSEAAIILRAHAAALEENAALREQLDRLKAELESANRAYADVMRAVDECGSYKP